MIITSQGIKKSPEYVKQIYRAFSDSILVFDDKQHWVVRHQVNPVIKTDGLKGMVQRAAWLENDQLIAELAEKLRDLKDVTYQPF